MRANIKRKITENIDFKAVIYISLSISNLHEFFIINIPKNS
jgi:hypothetical protein